MNPFQQAFLKVTQSFLNVGQAFLPAAGLPPGVARLIVTLLAPAILAIAQTPAAKPPAGNPQAGRKLFVADGCYQCHGYEAQGGVAGPRLGPNPISFAALTKYVRQPTGQMPPYTAKVLPDKDLADIYAFLQSIARPPDAKSVPLLNN